MKFNKSMEIVELVFKEQSLVVKNNGVINKIAFKTLTRYQDLIENDQIRAILSMINLA
ncbi:hypothetical protein GCM10010995_07430 [Cysteiniphilum litorale]|uniref:Uncharacterized protein n=1 Tax=Cysteiniphilum litorale TaxID=2056700 RepID=A0A8J2Z380_9GAMM|nr:hypothetical protein GCM10010995_07430 [Cysteiniphilum litorale]